MKLSGLFWHRLRHLLIFLIWWNITLRLFMYLRFAGQLDGGESVARSLALFRDNQWIITFAACLVSCTTWMIEEFVFYKILKQVGAAKGSAFRGLLYLVLFTALSVLVGIWYNVIIHNMPFVDSFERLHEFLFTDTWLFFFVVIVFSNMTMTLFVKAENYLGRGNVKKILGGAYKIPREENKIFMFLDLVSSSRAAELLGHQRYSRFLQESFADMTDMLIQHRATVYQYVGDEVVLIWNANKDANFTRCLNFYFGLCEVWREREKYYLEKYGIVPYFTASINAGRVMAAEVGEIKTELAYHGDVLNTAARIQKACKTYDAALLVTDSFVRKANSVPDDFTITLVDTVEFTGKQQQVTIHKVDSKSCSEDNCCYKNYYSKGYSNHKNGISNSQ